MATGQPIHVAKSNYLGKYELHGGSEVFSPENAHRHLLAHRKKHDFVRHKIKLKIFSNGLKVTRGSLFSEVYGHFYPFAHIQRFFVFRVEPRILLIGHQGHDMSKHFLIFQFDNETSLNRVCDEIERVKGSDRGSMLISGDQHRSLPNLNTQNRSPIIAAAPVTPSPLPSPTPRRQAAVVHQAPPPPPPLNIPPSTHIYESHGYNGSGRSSLSSRYRRGNKSASSYVINDSPIVQPRFVNMERSTPAVAPRMAASASSTLGRRVDILYASAPHSPSQKHHTHSGPCMKKTVDGHCDEWEASEIYIDYDQHQAPRVSRDGPIYMFSAQQKHSHQNSVITCESSDSDGDDYYLDGNYYGDGSIRNNGDRRHHRSRIPATTNNNFLPPETRSTTSVLMNGNYNPNYGKSYQDDLGSRLSTFDSHYNGRSGF